ncbi:hypothetical protein BT96DRAFT_826097 [Gymnopus androsaceus JB14]|uniref:DUF6534 domain-containing protein n=1 Tax=Gymnopus androsaceus JB14 TaxID=1447944 RepID=A0A6A4HE52_9AGAR|nr:hypothetical protein BT96DRAFT_826097 [Gymnopus androsaceus JB14]
MLIRSFGPMLIGVFLNMILYGVSRLPLAVVYLFIMETANTAIDMAMMYQPLIAGYGTFARSFFFHHLAQCLQRHGTSCSELSYAYVVLISTPIQFFFAWRIQKVTKSYWIPIVIVILLHQVIFLAYEYLAGGVITGAKIAILKLFIKKPELHWSALVWFLPSCVADLLITFTLVMSLHQRKTGFATTDSMIDRLIRLTVQTGMITSICAIGDVAFFLALPVRSFFLTVSIALNYIYVCELKSSTFSNFLWDLCLSKLYTNCLLSTLNARSTLRSNSGHSAGSSGVLSSREGRRQVSLLLA